MPESSLLQDGDPAARSLPDAHLSMAWDFAGLLLRRPDEILISRLDPVHRASHLLPDEVGGPLRTTVVHLERASLPQLQEEYAETFSGDDAEVVGQVCAALSEAANAAPGVGRASLTEHSALFESLHASLARRESGWAGAVAAAIATVPSPSRGGAAS